MPRSALLFISVFTNPIWFSWRKNINFDEMWFSPLVVGVDKSDFNFYNYETNLHSTFSIELDWIEEYRWVDPSKLWEAVSDKGFIQKWSHFQLDSLFSPHPCSKVMGKQARWQPPIFVSCLLIGPNGFTPLFRSSSITFTSMFADYKSRTAIRCTSSLPRCIKYFL